MRAQMWGLNMHSSRHPALLTLFGLTCLLHCQLQVPGSLLDKVPGPEISGFSVNGIAGVITGNRIHIDLRWRTETRNTDAAAITAAFIATANIYVGNVKQVSGTTVNDFRTPQTYVAKAADGIAAQYIVTVLAGYPIADTGQNQCSDDTAIQTCATVSGTHPRQDADYVDAPRAPAYSGPTQHPVYTNDYTTTDNVTGLVWKTCSEGQIAPPCTNSPSLYTLSPDTTVCGALNTANAGAGYAGLNNWRLPTIEELSTLALFDGSAPAINGTHFPSTGLGAYLSSTVSVASPTDGFRYLFNSGGIGTFPLTSSARLRCVSGGPATTRTPLFIENGNGTISDRTNKLLWQKCSMGKNNDATCSGSATFVTWSNALSYCQNLTLANQTWRLPNYAELSSIADFSAANPAINATFFPGTMSAVYKSSTSTPGTPGNSFNVIFSSGAGSSNPKTNSNYVRCVASES
ncbi:MAG: DUF1566 domain-containing protein [Spirochaetes bacterium]|nr:DUF1566 domain-containing protein [Spirochaetota bacterium]